MGATVDESYLGLSLSQQRAVVDLVDASGKTDSECSGVAVAPDWVLGAAHCAVISDLAARVAGAAGDTVSLVPSKGFVLHPTLDLALFELDFSSLAGASSLLELGVTPVPAADHELGLAVGDAVEIGGFGLDESGATGQRRFVVERLVAIDATALHVDGFGISGACEGDSGGPLLTRASDGTLWVAGILSAGAPSCVDQDRYVRLDDLDGWVQATAGSYDPPPQDCGSVGAEGRCFSGAALWCEAGALRVDDCSGAGATCGWDASQAGFRCVTPGASACQGVDAVGSCRGTQALSCSDGKLVRQSCGVCGACRPNGSTGAPYCAGDE